MAILTSLSHSVITSKNKQSEKRPNFQHPNLRVPDFLRPLRRWVDQIQVKNKRAAHLLCRIIPNRCPFERDISFFSHTVHIPALCQLNPLYNEVVSLRFRALTYLADTCNEDITTYLR